MAINICMIFAMRFRWFCFLLFLCVEFSIVCCTPSFIEEINMILHSTYGKWMNFRLFIFSELLLLVVVNVMVGGCRPILDIG